MVKVLQVFVFFFVAVWGKSISSSPNAVMGKIEKSFEEISDLVDNFKCGVPQPRSFPVSKFTDELENFVTPYIVLHRCGQAGCCDDINLECSVLTKETVPMKVNYYHGNVSDKFVTISPENHTSCACLQKPNIK